MLDQDKREAAATPILRYDRGRAPLPEVIIETDDEAEPEEKNLLELVVEKKARIGAFVTQLSQNRSKQEWAPS